MVPDRGTEISGATPSIGPGSCWVPDGRTDVCAERLLGDGAAQLWCWHAGHGQEPPIKAYPWQVRDGACSVSVPNVRSEPDFARAEARL